MLLSTAWNTVAYIFGIFANGFQDVFHFLICVVYTINLINLPTDLDVDEQRLLDKYDYVIVGGGSAGCVLANRLSADPSKMVLLIEAGGMEKPLAQIPLFAPLLIGSSFDWKYHPQPQEHACLSMEDRRCRLARGMALGGSSAINFMLYVRGNRRDYDIWRDEFGAHGWSYRDVFPHFKNIETARLPDQEPFYRGTHGEIPVEYASTQTRLSKAFLGACEENGYPVIDYNGRSQAGCSRLQFNTRHGQRYSASKSFITPILHRRNLHISLWSRATKVIFENQHAVGVRFLKGPRMHTVRASREVVIAAGAIGSPQLLLLSGVGPWFDLEQLKIPVIADLPVGRNLQDHMHVEGVSGTLRHRDGINLFWSSTVDYNNNCSGPFSIPASLEAVAFVSTPFVNTSLEFPDVEIVLQSLPPSDLCVALYLSKMALREDVYEQYFLPKRGQPGFALSPVMNRPKSRGYVKLRTTNPLDEPIIDPKYLTHPEDVAVAVEGVKIALRLIKSRAMRAIKAKPWDIPLEACASEGPTWSNEYLACFVRHMAHTTWHLCCTCPMGSDNRAVVDPRLRVYGLKNLRVVDASVMPTIVTGNLNAPVMMIADKAAAMILQDN
ncbi:alcohol dehydrogenase [acceptor]-like isoform X1 [Dermacentor andersoni]|uniref:alcohol dehydrogenase [acceptor]-like isoform X1 n=1 Tax=Dermacentor andersoni TaxID=34620 RepID=UPI002155A623|nr:alcohol dehydrogenase [acceptor]-like isoform X1 [Dermacentor andersoni]